MEREYHDNGKLKAEIPRNKQGQIHGVMKEWYDNGQLSREVSYDQGKLHGLLKWWHRNGKPWSEDFYRQGDLHGITNEWDSDGVHLGTIYCLRDEEVTQEEYEATETAQW